MWITSYVILHVGVIAALAVSLVAARQFGRIGSPSVAEESSGGLPVGANFADLSLTNTRGQTVRPATWEFAAILQVAIASPEDVTPFAELASVLPDALRGTTVVSAIGRTEFFKQVEELIGPVHLVHDTDRILELNLRTDFRPHALILQSGQVIGARTFESLADLEGFAKYTISNASRRVST